jgi:phospholipid/cholesterol/gamma-HCH transport system ATP-binding protein
MKTLIQKMELQDLTFAYEDHSPVFANVSCEVPQSRLVWVRALGGRGTSTLLKILAGLLTPQNGRYLINGQDVAHMSFEEFLPYRLNFGYGFDMGGLLNNKTIFENLILPLQYHKQTSLREAELWVDQVIDRFGLHNHRNLRPFAIPGSQRKLTCLLRAFIHAPQIVLLDDPLTGLKQDHLTEMYRFIEESFATRGLKQMFFTSESAELAKRFQAEELNISMGRFTTRMVA